MSRPVATPSQTVGPFFGIGFDWLERADLSQGYPAESRITIHGRVLDGDAAPVPDALVEIWQADEHGRYRHPESPGGIAPGTFFGFGRVPVNDNGEFRFVTIKPGCVPGPDGATQAPHLAISLFTRGLLRRLVTRIYFPGEPLNDKDAVLSAVPPQRRTTLIARDEGKQSLLWDVHLQGENETVFFDS